MITVFCSKCGNELTECGGLIFSPPKAHGWVMKHHLCESCWLLVSKYISKPPPNGIIPLKK